MVPRRCWLVFGLGAPVAGWFCGGGAGRAPGGGVGCSWANNAGAIAPVPASIPAKWRRFNGLNFNSFFIRCSLLSGQNCSFILTCRYRGVFWLVTLPNVPGVAISTFGFIRFTWLKTL